ncbi:MAG: hypothetical protein ACT4QC_11645 [Planctomycetaceae bacterium]
MSSCRPPDGVEKRECPIESGRVSHWDFVLHIARFAIGLAVAWHVFYELVPRLKAMWSGMHGDGAQLPLSVSYLVWMSDRVVLNEYKWIAAIGAAILFYIVPVRKSLRSRPLGMVLQTVEFAILLAAVALLCLVVDGLEQLVISIVLRFPVSR